MATDRLQIRLDAVDNTKRAFSSVKNSIFSLRNAFAALGIGYVIKQFVDTGRSVEDLNVRLKQLFGSAKEGSKAFLVMSSYASRVPFSLEQIQDASGNLAVVAGDSQRLSKILELTGNVAAVTGLDFKTTAEQIQRAFSGGIAAADIFREKGVRDMLGFKQGATVTAEETIKAFERVFGKNGRYGKATEELANTFTGTLSMLGDKLFQFKKDVADAQFFDELKKQVKDLDKFLQENTTGIKDFADGIGFGLTAIIRIVRGFARAFYDSFIIVRDGLEELILLLNKLPFVDISIVTRQEREFLNELAKHDRHMMNIKMNQDMYNGSLVKSNTLIAETLEKLKEQNQKFSAAGELVKGIQSGAKGVSTAIAESIVLGKKLNDSFRKLAGQILVNVIAKMIERKLLLLAEVALEKMKTSEMSKQLGFMKAMSAISRATGISGFFGGLFGGGAYGGTGSGDLIVGSSGMLGGGVAEGGSVKGGVPYTVGERGRELFVPDTNGTIVKNEDLGNIGGANITFNINAVDVTGVQELLIQNRSTITNLINQALNQRGKAALV